MATVARLLLAVTVSGFGIAPALVAQTPAASVSGAASEAVAFHASLWGTVVPLAAGIALAGTDATDPDGLPAFLLIAGGAAFGPSLGHFYAGNVRRGMTGAGIRTGVMLTTLAVVGALCDGCAEEDDAAVLITLGVGAAAVIGLAARDIRGARASVRARSEGLSLAPWLPLGERGIGVVATLRF